jgi:hypothetical protein
MNISPAISAPNFSSTASFDDLPLPGNSIATGPENGGNSAGKATLTRK